MNILTFSDGLQKRLQEINDAPEDDVLIRTGKKLTAVRNLILELKQFTCNYVFNDVQEEIAFYKETKPVLLSQYFYHKKIFDLQVFDSFKDKKSRTKNYYRVLESMLSFAQKNQNFYQYCLSGSTSFDKHYFTRNFHTSANIETDDRFSTGYDTMLSKMLAYELVKKHIMELLKKNDDDSPHSQIQTLTWTGAKTDLVELIYALHAVGAFNNATMEVRNIVEAFEAIFNIDLGNYYRTFLSIRIRKTGQTAFLEHLKQRLIQRINEIEDR